MSRFVKRRYLRNTSLSRTQRILQAKLVGQVATHKACAQAAILDNLYYFDFGCLTKRHMKFYTPLGDILSSTIKPLKKMNYLEKVDTMYEIRKAWDKFEEKLETHRIQSMKNGNNFEKAHLALSLAKGVRAQIVAISILLEESITQ